MTGIEKNEFSRVIEIEDSILDKRFTEEANEGERRALSARFEISSIESFRFSYIITPKADILGAFMFLASIEAKVTKFIFNGNAERVDINESFDVVFLTDDMARNNYEQLKDLDIEIFDEETHKVDVGEVASQYLSLCLFM